MAIPHSNAMRGPMCSCASPWPAPWLTHGLPQPLPGWRCCCAGAEGKTYLVQDVKTNVKWAIKLIKLPLPTRFVQAIFRHAGPRGGGASSASAAAAAAAAVVLSRARRVACMHACMHVLRHVPLHVHAHTDANPEVVVVCAHREIKLQSELGAGHRNIITPEEVRDAYAALF